MSANTLKKALENMQLELHQYAVAEAKAKKEKAEVELATAKIKQQHILKLIEAESRGMYNKKSGGLKS